MIYMCQSKLNLVETEKGIKLIKDNFEKKLAKELNLMRVSAPLFVTNKSGLNDNLNGVEKPVNFKISGVDDDIEIVHSLAKWKRLALKMYDIPVDSGIYTDMNAIRKDEIEDSIHSIYVDQWDWEKHISKEERTIKYLKSIVRNIYKAMLKTQKTVLKEYPNLEKVFVDKITFITSKKLLSLYPNLTSKERENEITKKYGSVFIIGIGNKLKNKKPHDLRAPDYDDWNLNGDILIYYPPLNEAVELSSMGIRVDNKSLVRQLEITNNMQRLTLPFHKALLNNELPLSIGGGIGQSRLCLVLLNKIHIGEVQSSIWDDEETSLAAKNNIKLL
ncbi:MAG: aspartate--ammonia ligase [Bacilli bacterium]